MVKISSKVLPGESPFYTDFLVNVLEDYPNAGINGVTVPSKYVNIQSNFEEIKEVFNEFYKFREIGSETVERFNYNVGKVFIRIAEIYDMLFELYSVKPLTRGRQIITDTDVDITLTKEKGTTIDTRYETNNMETFQDTPVTPLGEDEYATNITKRDNVNDGLMKTTGEDKDTTTRDTIQTMTTHDKMMAEEYMTISENLRTIIIEFVSEFEGCFINTIARI